VSNPGGEHRVPAGDEFTTQQVLRSLVSRLLADAALAQTIRDDLR